MAKRGVRECWQLERVDHEVVPVLVATDEDGAVVCVSLGADRATIERHAAKHGAHLVESLTAPSRAAGQLAEYFAGERTSFDLRLRPLGSEFQCSAWEALLAIPHGETRSYAEQARRLGNPRAVRAVGGANAANPLPIVIPCHRVIGSDGSLTGFGGGLPAKRWLLEHEAPQASLPLA